ncbi:MAG: O-antigen ligase family protein [Betaproteobacteria bacterium]
MIFAYAYLLTLFMAPQLWIPPFIDLPVDYLIYPIWLLYALLSGRLGRTKFCAPDFFFMAFIAWIALSIIVSGTTWNLMPIVVMKYVKWLVLYILIRCTVSSVADLRRVAAFIVALVYILVVEGIQHKLSPTGINWAGQPLGWIDPAVLAAGGTGRTKWIGVFDGIGVFAVVYTIALPFVLQYASSNFSATVRWLNRIGLPFLFVALYYTGSRGAFLATLALISLHLAAKYRVTLKTIILASTFVLVAFALAPSHLTQTRDSSNSAQNRVDVWAQGVSMLASNPVTGVGRGNFIEHTRTIIAHNSGVEIMAETGLIGLFLWVSIITSCLRAAYLRHQACQLQAERDIVSGIILSVVGYIISSFFVTLEYETFYLLLALCVGTIDAQSTKHLYRKRELIMCCAIVFVFVAAIKIVAMLY